MADTPNKPLPSFRNPPVVETALAVQLAPIAGWEIPHFGVYWHSELKKTFPKWKVQPPVTGEIEAFDPTPTVRSFQIQLMQEPEVRCWFISEDDQQLVQIQKDRFIFNWRKLKPDVVYPRYDQYVRPAFEQNWVQFNSFLESSNLAACEALQCELTYTNHIPKGDGWQTVEDWSKVFSGFLKSQPTFLPPRESMRMASAYVLPDKRGRLRITAHQAVRQSDSKEIIVLTLTCRGRPKSSELSDILEWFDLGREWVVRGFTDITSNAMHTLWEREN